MSIAIGVKQLNNIYFFYTFLFNKKKKSIYPVRYEYIVQINEHLM